MVCFPTPFTPSDSDNTSAAFALYNHEMNLASQEGDSEGVTQARHSMLSLANVVIYATESTDVNPLDIDAVAYWSNRIAYLAAMAHIRFGPRDDKWASKIKTLTNYLQYFSPRFQIYRTFPCRAFSMFRQRRS